MARRLELARLLDRCAVARARPVPGDDRPARCWRRAPSLRPRARWASRRWPQSSASRAPTRTTSTRRWTGWASVRSASRSASRAGTWPTVSWCSTTCRRARTSRAARCPLAALGYSRDGRRGTPQIVYGLLTRPGGRPVAVAGVRRRRCTTTRPSRPARQAQDALRPGAGRAGRRSRHGHQGEHRGAARRRRGRLDHRAQGATGQEARHGGDLQPSLFDEINLAEITSEELPGRAAGRLPQPAGRRRAHPQARASCSRRPRPSSRRSPTASTRGGLTDAGEIGLAVGPALSATG